MQIPLNGESHEIEFKFRETRLVLKHLGNPSLKDAENTIASMGAHNTPEIIRLVVESNRKRHGSKAKAPTLAEIEDALDDNPSLLGDFVAAFSRAYMDMYGGLAVDAPDQAGGRGN